MLYGVNEAILIQNNHRLYLFSPFLYLNSDVLYPYCDVLYHTSDVLYHSSDINHVLRIGEYIRSFRSPV